MDREKLDALYFGLTRELRDENNLLWLPGWQIKQLTAAGIISSRPDFRYKWSTWEPERLSFIETEDGLKSPTRIVLDWVAEMEHPTSIWLVGDTGVGKDHLAHIAAVALAARRGWTVQKVDWVVEMQSIKSSFGGGPWVDTSLGKLKRADVLIWSDIDRPNTSLYVVERVGELVRAREDKCTIFTANCDLRKYCKQVMRTSKVRDEQLTPHSPNPLHAALQQTADTIESRLYGMVKHEVEFVSIKGDWRKGE